MQQATQVNVTFPGTTKTGKQASVFPKKQKMKAAFVYVSQECHQTATVNNC